MPTTGKSKKRTDMMVKSKSKLWHVKLTLKKVINQIVFISFKVSRFKQDNGATRKSFCYNQCNT